LGCLSCVGLMRDFADEDDIVTLRLKEPGNIPVEADSICPDLFVDRNLAEIKALKAFYGRRKVTLGDLFIVEGERSDRIQIEGDLQHVKKIGMHMSQGRIIVRGDVGPHLGAHMKGGEIFIQGNASDWVGAQMRGGRIWIKGNAGHHLGAAYPGEQKGVNRGVIIVEGNAGREVGARARRVLIVVRGSVGDFAGANMIAGLIIVFGQLGRRAGAGNKRGSIVVFGGPPEILPTYRYECTLPPVFLRVYLQRLGEWGFPVSVELADGIFRRYSGDLTSVGKGEILVYVKPE